MRWCVGVLGTISLIGVNDGKFVGAGMWCPSTMYTLYTACQCALENHIFLVVMWGILNLALCEHAATCLETQS